MPSREKRIRESNPTRPIVPHGRTLRCRRVVYLTCASLNVAAGHSRRGHVWVSDAGGSRRSYRNGRAFAVAEGTPFPEGPPESSVGGFPGWHLSSSAREGVFPGYASESFVISVQAYLPLPEGDQAPWSPPSSRSAGVHRHACVACMGLQDLVLSRCSQGARRTGKQLRLQNQIAFAT